MLHYMFLPYRRYFDFQGRSSRAEFWSFFLLGFAVLVVTYVLYMISGAMEPGFDPDTHETGATFYLATAIFGIFALVSVIPGIALEVRRWHDIGKTGWFWFIRFVPVIGPLVVLAFMAMKGNAGGNQYGPDPLPSGAAHAFA